MSKEMNKITKKMVLAAVLEMLEGESDNATIGDIPVPVARDVISGMITQLDAKAAKAAERAAKVRAEGDELREQVFSVLTNEFQTIPTIITKLDAENITPAKVSARLTQLCKLDRVHKTKLKMEDGRTLNGYAAGPDLDTE